MRTISNLLTNEGRIYVFLGSRNICGVFLKNAEAEGFTFEDGVKPTKREYSDIFALNRDWTINYVGYIGHLAFRSADAIEDEPLIRIDYGKYLSGRDDYLMEK